MLHGNELPKARRLACVARATRQATVATREAEAFEHKLQGRTRARARKFRHFSARASMKVSALISFCSWNCSPITPMNMLSRYTVKNISAAIISHICKLDVSGRFAMSPVISSAKLRKKFSVHGHSPSRRTTWNAWRKARNHTPVMTAAGMMPLASLTIGKIARDTVSEKVKKPSNCHQYTKMTVILSQELAPCAKGSNAGRTARVRSHRLLLPQKSCDLMSVRHQPTTCKLKKMQSTMPFAAMKSTASDEILWPTALSKIANSKPQMLNMTCKMSYLAAPFHHACWITARKIGSRKGRRDRRSAALSPEASTIAASSSGHTRFGAWQTRTSASRNGRPHERESMSFCHSRLVCCPSAYLQIQSCS
mmetsp:Transcript_60335/g.184314  ORF Transcript_60335/g.184314 Transcript_60335/m.184314 type:complete len:366 (+) Transcript_60335:336-1433(+)